MALTTLDVVNDMLGLLGERRVNSLAEPHPLIPDALAKLDTATTIVQADLWWFNVEYPTLTPQSGRLSRARASLQVGPIRFARICSDCRWRSNLPKPKLRRLEIN